jgi:hypothetical protein
MVTLFHWDLPQVLQVQTETAEKSIRTNAFIKAYDWKSLAAARECPAPDLILYCQMISAVLQTMPQ